MKHSITRRRILTVLLAAALIVSCLPAAFAAEGDTYVYGTMDMTYTEFYANEAENVGEVDAVTTATMAKVLENAPGQQSEGTWNNGVDTLYGPVYPVAITKSDLAKLGSDNHNFQEIYTAETIPANYKIASVGADGTLSFSRGVAEETVVSVNDWLTIEEFVTDTEYGDYLIKFNGMKKDTENGGITFNGEESGNNHTMYGLIVYTTDGSPYAMKILENTWIGGNTDSNPFELSWSCGFVTEVSNWKITDTTHMSWEPYVSIMGKTIDHIDFITEDGIYRYGDMDMYVPITTDKVTATYDYSELDKGGNTIIHINIEGSVEGANFCEINTIVNSDLYPWVDEIIDVNDPDSLVTVLSADENQITIKIRTDNDIYLSNDCYQIALKDANGIYAEIRCYDCTVYENGEAVVLEHEKPERTNQSENTAAAGETASSEDHPHSKGGSTENTDASTEEHPQSKAESTEAETAVTVEVAAASEESSSSVTVIVVVIAVVIAAAVVVLLLRRKKNTNEDE